jgi:ribonuclease III
MTEKSEAQDGPNFPLSVREKTEARKRKRKSEGDVPEFLKKPKIKDESEARQKLRPWEIHALTTDEDLTNGEPRPALPPLPHIKPELAKAVFTHQSVVGSEKSGTDLHSYERLEFLGDAYIEAMATRLIWDKFKYLPTGRLSQIRELLVKNETLAEYCVLYGFVEKLAIARGVRNNEKIWRKVKGDVFEAYLAAIILSDPIRGFETAEEWLTQLWLPKIENIDTSPPKLEGKQALAKTVLVHGVKIEYLNERPPDQPKGGIQTYFVGAYFTGFGWERLHLGSGQGLNKIEAGNQAAENARLNHAVLDPIIEKRAAFIEARKIEKEEAERLGTVEMPNHSLPAPINEKRAAFIAAWEAEKNEKERREKGEPQNHIRFPT